MSYIAKAALSLSEVGTVAGAGYLGARLLTSANPLHGALLGALVSGAVQLARLIPQYVPQLRNPWPKAGMLATGLAGSVWIAQKAVGLTLTNSAKVMPGCLLATMLFDRAVKKIAAWAVPVDRERDGAHFKKLAPASASAV